MDELSPIMVLGIKPKTVGGKVIWTVWFLLILATTFFSLLSVVGLLVSLPITASYSKVVEQLGLPAFAASTAIGSIVIFWIFLILLNLFFKKVYKVWE